MNLLSIQKSQDFKKISKDGKKFYSKTVLLLTLPTPSFYLNNPEQQKNLKDFCRVGYTVSKTVGNAVSRNLAKRRLREIFRSLSPSYVKNNHDYVLIARKEIADAEFQSIKSDLNFCLKNIHRTSEKK